MHSVKLQELAAGCIRTMIPQEDVARRTSGAARSAGQDVRTRGLDSAAGPSMTQDESAHLSAI